MKTIAAILTLTLLASCSQQPTTEVKIKLIKPPYALN